MRRPHVRRNLPDNAIKMGTEKHIIRHQLDHGTAKKAADRAFSGYAERFADYNPTAEWVTDDRSEISFSAKGITMRGALELHPGEIHLELEVPFIFRPFKKKAMAVIDEQIQMWIGKAMAGEIDD